MEERLCRLEPCGVEILRQKNTIKYPLSVVPSFVAKAMKDQKHTFIFVCFLLFNFMKIYLNKNGKLEYIKEIGFKLERDMQSLAEKNLWEIFSLEFISTEFSLNNLRIDTVAFDKESNAFVIIEFKRWSSYSVIDQWFSYLSLILNNQADFILLLQEKMKKNFKKNDIDWSQTRVVFIADTFTRYQQESINFKDLPIELWEMKQFSDWNIIFNQIKASNTSESIKTITKFEWDFKEIEKVVKTYSEEYHLEGKSENIKELYQKLKEILFSLIINLEVIPKKQYVAYKINKRNIVDIEIRRNDIKIWINAKKWEIKDWFWISEDVSKKWHWWNGDYEILINSKTNLIQLAELIEQAYKIYWNN